MSRAPRATRPSAIVVQWFRAPLPGSFSSAFRIAPGLRQAAARFTTRQWGPIISAALLLLPLSGCDQLDQMRNNSRLKPLEYSEFFADGRSSRPLVDGTVPRGYLRDDTHLYTGKVDGQHVSSFPFPITKDILERGRERYNIYCIVCHGGTGNGQGMVVQRGFKQPTSFHDKRLREAPVGYYFEIITNGFGVMPPYADKVEPNDRWAVIAYIRALQLSQHATLNDVPPDMRGHLSGTTGQDAEGAGHKTPAVEPAQPADAPQLPAEPEPLSPTQENHP